MQLFPANRLLSDLHRHELLACSPFPLFAQLRSEHFLRLSARFLDTAQGAKFFQVQQFDAIGEDLGVIFDEFARMLDLEEGGGVLV